MEVIEQKQQRVKRQKPFRTAKRERLFVGALQDGKKIPEAIREAGYNVKSNKVASVMGSELLKRPSVLAMLADNEREAEKVIVNILTGKNSLDHDKLGAAKLLLAYTRGNPVSRNENVNVSVSLEDILRSDRQPV